MSILFPAEAEAFVESLSLPDYEVYGKEIWYRQHSYLDKLNMQSVASARSGSDEFIKEYIISHNKVSFLIKDLISTESWKEKVLRRLLKKVSEKEPTFPIYVIVYHELILVTLLETITYHVDIVDSLAATAVDLCDWCHRAMCRLVSLTSTDERKAELQSLKDKTLSLDSCEEINRQNRVISFEVGMKSISISRHMIDHSSNRDNSVSSLPLCVGRRILQTHDFLILLCQLIYLSPWNCEVSINGSTRPTHFQWHESGVWIPESDDTNWKPVTKSEAQVWLSIYQLVFSDIMSSVNYDMTLSHRRQALLGLRQHLTEIRIDVIPVLGELRRFLEQLAVSNLTSSSASVDCSNSSSAFAVAQLCHVELVAEERESLLLKNKGKWDDIATEFLDRIQGEEGQLAAQRAASRWAELYSEDNVDAVLGGPISDQMSSDTFQHPLLPPTRCVVCGELATKRCSRCRQEWYCRRECQVSHWAKHKKACDLLVSDTSTP